MGSVLNVGLNYLKVESRTRELGRGVMSGEWKTLKSRIKRSQKERAHCTPDSAYNAGALRSSLHYVHRCTLDSPGPLAFTGPRTMTNVPM